MEKQWLTISYVSCAGIVTRCALSLLLDWFNKYSLVTLPIFNFPYLKPIDKKAILKAAEEMGIILTCEEHQAGGFGNIIAGVIAQNKEYSTPCFWI